MSTAQFAEMSRSQAESFMAGAKPQAVRARMSQIVGPAQVIDIGCGKGEEVAWLYRPWQYLGVDCSPELVRLARQRNPGYEFLAKNALDLDGRWPFAVMKAVLEHLPPDEAVEVYEHARTVSEVLLLAWHTEPGREHLTTYDGELGTMAQNRHDRDRFEGVRSRHVVGPHVLWVVE